MFKPVFMATVLGLLLAADAGCKKKGEETAQPEDVADDEGAPKKSKGVSEANEDSLISSPPASSDSGEEAPATTDMDSAVAKEDPAKKRPEVKEVCKKKTTGKGKAKKTETVCEMVDSNPKLTASLGIASLTKGFEWGMNPDAVLAKLPKDKNGLVVAYCGNEQCGAYKAAAAKAAELGYTNVKHYSKGIAGWKKSGEKTEKADKS